MKAMHLFDVDATMEDTEVLGMAFHGQQYTLPVYGYHAWWRDGRPRPQAYAVPPPGGASSSQSRRPPDLWLFKAPHHNFHLEAIVDAYPDARFVDDPPRPGQGGPVVGEHRVGDPPAGRTASRDLHRLGREVVEPPPRSASSTRSRRGPASVRTASSTSTTADLVADPMGTVARDLRRSSGWSSTRGGAGLPRRGTQVNRTGAHGTHRYTAEQFGLTRRPAPMPTSTSTSDHFDIELEALTCT